MKKTWSKLLALALALVLCLSLLPAAALAGGTETVTIKKVVYTDNGNGTCSAAITFTYSGNKITYIDPMIGKNEGSYEYDLDTKDVLNLPEGWALKKNEDGSYTLIANPLGFTGGIGKPPAGTEAWVGVEVSTMDGDNYSSGYGQLKITVPGEGEFVEVERPGGSGGGGDKQTVAIPSAVTGLVYDGTQQTGVPSGTGYTLTGNTATNAGDYTATATLQDGFEWAGGSTGNQTIPWSIAQATLTGIGSPDISFVYDGKVQKPSELSINVYADSGIPSRVDGDYTISYSNPDSTEIGSYTVTATGAGNFTGSASLTYKIISDKDLGAAEDVGLKEGEGAVYTKAEAERVGLKIGDKVLIPGVDYTKTVTEKEGDSTKWTIKAEPIGDKTTGERTIDVEKAPNNYHNVTVNYVFKDTGATAAPTVVQSFAKGVAFAIPSPKTVTDDNNAIYKPSQGYAVGTMGDTDQVFTITYSNEQTVGVMQFTVDVVYNINYKNENEQVETPKPVRLYLESGKSYSVTSPTIAGYQPDIQVVQGKVENENVMVSVTYKPQYTLTINYVFPNGKVGHTYTQQLADGAKYSRESADVITDVAAEKLGFGWSSAKGATVDLTNVWTPNPAVVEGTISGADVTREVTFTCAHPTGSRRFVKDNENTHHQECGLCGCTIGGSEKVHSYGEGYYVPENEIPAGVTPEGRTTKANGATAYPCTKGCGHIRYVDADAEICPASSKDDPQPHLWSIWKKTSDTECERSCARCGAVMTAPHAWSEWTYVSSASHSRMCTHCHATETGTHGNWSNVSVTSPATCISNASVSATCGICGTNVSNVFYGIVGTISPDYVALGHDFGGGYINLHGGHTHQCQREGCTAFDMEHHEEHSWGEWYATGDVVCGTPTTFRRDCTKCSAYEKEERTREHIWTEDAANSKGESCTEAGVKAYKCLQPGCTATKTEALEALGHDWVENDGNCAATCLTEGHLDQYCTRCSAILNKEIPTLSPDGQHHYEHHDEVTATCTLPGDKKSWDECIYCHDKINIVEEPTEKLGHSLKESKDRINWRERVVSQSGKRPAVIYEEVFYVTRECTRCGYHAPSSIYTVARSQNLNKYQIETGDVKVNLFENGIRVTGQFIKDGGAYFNQTVESAFQSRLKLDNDVFSQRPGSIITTFTQSYLDDKADGEYFFILTNGDELGVAKVTVTDHRLTEAEDGVFDGHLNAEAIEAMTAKEFEAYLATEAAAASMMTDGEYQFLLGAVNEVMTAGLGGNDHPFVAIKDSDSELFISSEPKDITVLQYDKGRTFATLTHGGEEVYVIEGDAGGLDDIYFVAKDTDAFTFSKAYLSTLGDGLHEFQFNYTDGTQALLYIIVNGVIAPPEEEASQDAPIYYGGGGGSVETVYKIIVEKTEHGKVTASRATAPKGAEITLAITPDKGFQTASIKVVDAKGNTIIVKDDKFTMPAADVTVTVTFGIIPKDRPFTDVKEGDWFYDAVYYCYDMGWFKGTGTTTFDPQGTMTRAMFATVLWRIAGEPKAVGGKSFTDVEPGQWYSEAILWASGAGIVEGYGDGTFGTNDPITREQLATILYRCAQHKGEGFKGLWNFKLDFPDAGEVSVWAIEAVSWMVMNGVINGKDGKLVPGGNASRAEAATMLQRFSAKIAE